MQQYAYCGHVLRSTVPLPELEPALAASPDVRTWICGPGVVDGDGDARTVHHWATDAGDPWLEIVRAGPAYVLHFTAGPSFRIEEGTVAWHADADTPSDTLRHLLLDQVLPLAMSARGEYVLHASAVRVHGRAIILAGPSGRGKSTLAARCVAAGADLLADDCVRITDDGADGVVAHASYPGLRLWRDALGIADPAAASTPVAHYTGKLRFAMSTPVAAAPVHRIYLLERGGTSMPRETRADAAAAADVARFVFRVDPRRREHIAADFATTASLVNAGVVRRLRVPDSLAALDAAAAAIEQAARRGAEHAA